MKLLGSIKVLKLWFKHDSLSFNLIVHLCDSFHHFIFFGIIKLLKIIVLLVKLTAFALTFEIVDEGSTLSLKT